MLLGHYHDYHLLWHDCGYRDTYLLYQVIYQIQIILLMSALFVVTVLHGIFNA